MTDLDSAVADLQSRWHVLCDLDRARVVRSIQQAGMSLKALAPQLSCSSSLLSYFLQAAQTPAENRELARFGEITTRELVHRTSASRGRRDHKAQDAVDGSPGLITPAFALEGPPGP